MKEERNKNSSLDESDKLIDSYKLHENDWLKTITSFSYFREN